MNDTPGRAASAADAASVSAGTMMTAAATASGERVRCAPPTRGHAAYPASIAATMRAASPDASGCRPAGESAVNASTMPTPAGAPQVRMMVPIRTPTRPLPPRPSVARAGACVKVGALRAGIAATLGVP